MKSLDLQAVVYKEDTYYVSQCLNVDVASFGSSEEEALENLKEAVELHFEDTASPKLVAVTNPELKSFTLQSA